MTMGGNSPDLDRLIEEGLTLYGQGDLDGALSLWEQVLEVEPENAQANSYVDYVRLNYELLVSEASTQSYVPFGIADDDEPEYQIEITPGTLEPVEIETIAVRDRVDALDEGWAVEDDITTSAVRPDPVAPASAQVAEAELELELEADEPTGGPPDDVSFDVSTNEYEPNKHHSVLELAAEFGGESTPGLGGAPDAGSFADQTTDIRKRELGFVKPAATPVPPAAVPPKGERPLTSQEPIPEEVEPDTVMRQSGAGSVVASDLEDTVARPSGSRTTADPGELVGLRPRAPTAPNTSDEDHPIEPPLPLGLARTQAFGSPALPRRTDGDAAARDPRISAPTRELGPRAPERFDEEDEPTASATRALREGAVPSDRTQSEIMLPFGPIDARNAQILGEVDEDAPREESKEDQTRRRITLLIERATEWASANDLARAVAAVDLALSEDPNSALAQKLIHRHREPIMNVFQGFLGDLDRQPVLALPLQELANAPLGPRAAFQLSRVDGTLTVDEILDVSGMPRLEAYRYLCKLFLGGILR